jgi:hypothetical protein
MGYPSICSDKMREPMQDLSHEADVRAKISTKHLPNISHCYTKPTDDFS